MRRLSGLLLAVILALLLAACGAEDEDEDPTAELTEVTATVESSPGDEDTGVTVMDDATPATAGSPVAIGTPAVVASPVLTASPVIGASPVASPQSGGAVVPVPAGGDAAAGMQTLAGTIVLPGVENEAFVLSDDGCVGLGEFDSIGVGRQVVVRDASGAIVGVTTLAATEATDTCAWSFTVDVPGSEYYAVSVPMALEYIVTSDEVENSEGEITITLQ